MILLIKLLIATAFLVLVVMTVFKLAIGIRMAAEGRKESNERKIRSGRTKAVNSVVALLLILVVAYFVFTELISFDFTID